MAQSQRFHVCKSEDQGDVTRTAQHFGWLVTTLYRTSYSLVFIFTVTGMQPAVMRYNIFITVL